MSLKGKVVNRLTDAYNKSPHSIIAKVIGIVVSEFNTLSEEFERIEHWRSIDNAKGRVLDEIGIDLKQYRGDVSDEVYRVLLKSKRARDLSTGDTNTIISVLSMAIDADKKDIGITESWYADEGGKPNTIKIINIPISNLNKVGMTGNQFVKFVSATVAAGVRVESIDLQGTFEYGSINEDYDEEKGFADIEQTIGGYYGALYQPDREQELPV